MSTEELAKEQEAKKLIVIESITGLCNENSEFEELREIGAALEAGDKLGVKVIAGGKTNFSYKVFLEGTPGKSLFAKINFKYALWNPDKSVHYDLSRAENEYKLMKRFKGMMENAPVVTPYHCVDISNGDMKLVVTEWSKADEQFANQFIDGSVDKRILPKLGEALATLNSADFDPDFNQEVKGCMLSLFPIFRGAFEQYIAMPEAADKAVVFAKELGMDTLNEICDNMLTSYETRDILCHSDSHVFNILVEKKPSIESLQNFGEKGDLALCDWEMAYAGPKGRDIGIFHGFPIAAAMAHAIQGNTHEALDILECMFIFWKAYADTLIKNGKDAEYLRDTYRNLFGWAAFFVFGAYYVMHIHMEYLPLEGVSEEDQAKMFGSIGLIGVKFLHMAFTDTYKDKSVEEMETWFRELVTGEIEWLNTVRTKRARRNRRASVLRETGRRVSDASVFEEAARRVSELSVGGGERRLSVYTDVLVHETLEEILDTDENTE